MIIRVDIDETICRCPEGTDRTYENTQPIHANIAKINKLYDEGHTIVYWTARGSRSGINWHEFTKKQLDAWGAKYHELDCTKPYYDLFVEDKSVKIENLCS